MSALHEKVAQSEPLTHKSTILIAEMDKSMHGLMERLLRVNAKFDGSMVFVLDMEAAESELRARALTPPDLVIVSLGNENISLLESLRSEDEHQAYRGPIIAIHTNPLPENIKIYEELDASHIQEPYDIAEFVEKVTRALA